MYLKLYSKLYKYKRKVFGGPWSPLSKLRSVRVWRYTHLVNTWLVYD